MNIKPLILVACIAPVMSFAIVNANVNHTALAATSNISYSCGSVHFGMKDDDNSAMTYDCSTASSNFSGYYTANGITVSSISATNCYTGGAYTASNTDYSQYAVRIGKSKSIGTLTLTFASEIVGCTVYALQYASDPVTVVVNGQETTLAHNVSSVTKANAAVAIYDAYSFEFDATTTLTITSKQASKTVGGKSVSASRFYLADIALRVL